MNDSSFSGITAPAVDNQDFQFFMRSLCSFIKKYFGTILPITIPNLNYYAFCLTCGIQTYASSKSKVIIEKLLSSNAGHCRDDKESLLSRKNVLTNRYSWCPHSLHSVTRWCVLTLVCGFASITKVLQIFDCVSRYWNSRWFHIYMPISYSLLFADFSAYFWDQDTRRNQGGFQEQGKGFPRVKRSKRVLYIYNTHTSIGRHLKESVPSEFPVSIFW